MARQPGSGYRLTDQNQRQNQRDERTSAGLHEMPKPVWVDIQPCHSIIQRGEIMWIRPEHG